MLCRTCHAYVHLYPNIAGALGFIVSRYESRPSTCLVKTAQGWAILTCDGDALWVSETRITMVDGVPRHVPA